jgi:hypothetical protein
MPTTPMPTTPMPTTPMPTTPMPTTPMPTTPMPTCPGTINVSVPQHGQDGHGICVGSIKDIDGKYYPYCFGRGVGVNNCNWGIGAGDCGTVGNTPQWKASSTPCSEICKGSPSWVKTACRFRLN